MVTFLADEIIDITLQHHYTPRHSTDTNKCLPLQKFAFKREKSLIFWGFVSLMERSYKARKLTPTSFRMTYVFFVYRP